jgi:metal-responsive CopG/Arc/MetJ family transcriptional regulator
MSRFLVDLTEKQKTALERLSAKEKRSRASLVREAIDVLVQSRKKKKSALEATFGLWGDRAVDGVEYQRKIRSEW